MRNLIKSLCLSVVLSSLCACSLIDDDMADCSYNRTIDIRIHPYDDVDSTLAAQVNGSGTQALREALSVYCNGLLNPPSRNVNMTFFDYATGDSCTTINRNMQGNEATFSVELPQGDLRCEATAQQYLFSGSAIMPNGQERYPIDLYPTRALVAVATKTDSTITSVQMSVGESTALTLQPSASAGQWLTYTGTVTPTAEGQPWRVVILATTASGSVTRTVLTVSQPLRNGNIRVLLISIGGNGAAATSATDVGASVTLNWKKGGEYNPDI